MRLRVGLLFLAALSGAAAWLALAAGARPATLPPFPKRFPAYCGRADFPVGKRTVRAELCRASGGGRHPALLVLHGCGGFNTLDHRLAVDLPQAGYSTLYVDYFGLTPPSGNRGFCGGRGRGGGFGDPFPVWETTVSAAAASLRRRPDVDPGRIGLVGWSLGAGLAISVAEQADASAPRRSPKQYAVVVAYSAGAFGPTLANARDLPPTLVLSGGARDAMPVADSIALRDALRAAHVPSELYIYPNGTHNWAGPQYQAGLSHTLAFLRRYLG